MASKVGYSYLDASGEISRVEMNILTLTAGNFAAETGPVVEGGAVEAALSAMSLCALSQVDIVASRTPTGNAAPVNLFAQRESGLMITYQDTVTGKKYRCTLPGPDRATIGLAGTDQVDTADALWLAFVAAFEANIVSEFDNPVTVLSGTFVGRAR